MTKRPPGLNKSPGSPETMSRRSMMTATAALPLSVQLSADAAAGNDAIASLIERAREKNAAFMRGDMDRWFQLVRIAPDFTLMQPFGGPASRGFDASPKRLADLSRYFREGETELEVLQTYASNELVVLVMVEHQRAEVGGLAAQDWSLRVTEVYRKDGTDWQLVHRHADPLVRSITLQQAAILARGWREEK
ncbi:nuclear transport factor 2 family protein [Bradyrhizobium sp. 179]|uniref:YybH family protein n=1 Tax=Bradyrhizobium sp. 179 TaxID=2782648 RepID=UPI001FFB7B02|nr:nuclear transport factor 2 family protein [Bradyrhizobium sp. 179]MCK1544556.1 nuclear transport factor 2 family protein [Bradyrhizobium sp. 179]